MNTVEMLKKLGACEDGFEWLHRQGTITPMQAWTACPHGSSLVWLLMRVDYPSFQLISMLRNLIKPQVLQLRAGHLARTTLNLVDRWLHENATLEEVKKARIQVWASHEELIASITPERARPVQVADIHAIAAAGFLLDTVIDVARIEEAKKPRGPLLRTSEARLAAARSAHNTLWRGAEAAAAYAVAQVGPAKEVDPSPDPEQQPQTVVHIYEELAGEGVEPTVQVTPLEKGRAQVQFRSLPKKISDAVVTNLRKGHEVGQISSFQLNQTRNLQVLREVGVESIRWEKNTSKAVTLTLTNLRVNMPKVLEVLGFTLVPPKGTKGDINTNVEEEAAYADAVARSVLGLPPIEVYGGSDERVELKFIPKDEPISILSIPAEDRPKVNANGDSFYATPLEKKLKAYTTDVRQTDQLFHNILEARGTPDNRPVVQATLLLMAEDRLKLKFYEAHRDLRGAIVNQLRGGIEEGRLTHFVVREQCDEGRSTTPDVGSLSITLSCKEFSKLLTCLVPTLRMRLMDKAMWLTLEGDDGPDVPVLVTHILSVPVLTSISEGKRSDWFATSLKMSRGRIVALGPVSREEQVSSAVQVTQEEVNEAFGASGGVVQEWLKQHAERMQKNRFTQEFREALKEERPKDNRTACSLVEVPYGWDEETWGRHYTAVQTNRPYNEPAHPQNVAYYKALQDYADRLREQVKWSEVWDLLGAAVGQKSAYL